MKLEKAVQRVFDRCNLQDENVEIYNEMFRYKAITNLSEKERDSIYDYIALKLGYMPNITDSEKTEIENKYYSVIRPAQEIEQTEPEPMNRTTWKMYAHLTRLAFYLYCDEKVTGSRDITRAEKTANTILFKYMPAMENYNQYHNAIHTMLEYQHVAKEKRK